MAMILFGLAVLWQAAHAAETIDLGETLVEQAQKTRAVSSVTPNQGTALGGTRLSIIGEGFATDLFDGSNMVEIGDDSSGWVGCDVIEGACTVDCGGPYRIVCDTGPWLADEQTGWLDVRVTVTEGEFAATATCAGCYAFRPSSHASAPRLTSVSPRHAGAGDVLQLLGENLGEAVEDYTNIYVGAGRPPQGGNIDTGASDDAHAVCRADEHNLAADAATGALDASSVPVMAEDAIVGHGSPIVADQVFCALGDFPAGSFTVAAFLNDAIDDGFARAGLAGLTHDSVAGRSKDAGGIEV